MTYAQSDAVLAAAGDRDALDRLPQGDLPPDGVALIALPAQYLRQLVRFASFPDATVEVEFRGPDANGYFLPLFNVDPRSADPLHVEGPPDLTDIATHATGWYLTALVVVAAALLVAIYGVTRA